MSDVIKALVAVGVVILIMPLLFSIMEEFNAAGGLVATAPGIQAYEIAYWKLIPILLGFGLFIAIIVDLVRGRRRK